MTDFKKASKGIGKVFLGEILELIGKILLYAGIGVIAVAGVMALTDDGSSAAGIIIGVIVLLVGLVLELVAFIIQMVGLNQTGKQNGSFKIAFILIIFAILSALVGGVLEVVIPNSSIIGNIITTISEVINIFVTLLIISGCGQLAAEKGNTAISEKASNLSWIIALLYLAGAAFQFVPQAVNTFGQTVQIVCVILFVVCEVVAYIMYLSVLAKTKKALAE